MKQIILFFFSISSLRAFSQDELSIVDKRSGLRLSVINKTYPLLKLLLPQQSNADRGIEIEFPEHVTGLNLQNQSVQHLYFVSLGNRNKRTLPVWKIDANTIRYETVINGNIKLVAKATLDSLGIGYNYTFTNLSDTSYEHLQAVTCVKLYSVFSDTLLERFYIHGKTGFELLASDTPDRMTLPLNKWLPCRYLVSYTWPVPLNRIQKDVDGRTTRYYKSIKADKPFIATLSHDKKWVVATYTTRTGNLWTNPETPLPARQTKTLGLRTFIYKGSLDALLKYVE